VAIDHGKQRVRIESRDSRYFSYAGLNRSFEFERHPNIHQNLAVNARATQVKIHHLIPAFWIKVFFCNPSLVAKYVSRPDDIAESGAIMTHRHRIQPVRGITCKQACLVGTKAKITRIFVFSGPCLIVVLRKLQFFFNACQ